MFRDANDWSTQAIEVHQRYAEWTGMTVLQQNLADCEPASIRLGRNRWPASCPSDGGRTLLEDRVFEYEDEALRQVLRQVPFYARAIQSGLRFLRPDAWCSWGISRRHWRDSSSSGVRVATSTQVRYLLPH